jgi:tetratricopeptide (TPR) repeat protein
VGTAIGLRGRPQCRRSNGTRGTADLKPSVPSFTRVSYSFELRGDPKQARKALERALEVASTPSDISYALHYLGELAWNSGDVDAAAERYVEGLRHDPSYVPLIAGMAKVAAARGEIEAALARYAEVVSRRPEPSYVIAYADLLASLGREEEAEQQYAVVAATQRLFESQGVNVDLELAVYEADHGRSESALAIAEAEWERRRSVHTEDAYAWALHVGGRHREALDHAKAAAALGTHSASFAYHRGMIEQSLGMDGAAEASLRRALETNPHFSPLQAPRAEAALRQLEQSS